MHECPYCLNPILETDEVVTCRVCGTPYHAECLEENGGCAIKDCEKLIRPAPIEIAVDAEPHTHLVLSREAVEKAPEAAPRRLSNPCLTCGVQVPYGEIYCAECMPVDDDRLDQKRLWPTVLMIAAVAIVVAWLSLWLLAPRYPGADRSNAGTPPQHTVR